MKTDFLNLLKTSKIFSSLNKTVLNKLLAKFEKIAVPKGKIVFRQGELADSIYFVVRGKLAIFFKPEKKPRKLINEILPGQTTGELSALSCGPRSATAKAVKTSYLLKLSSEDFIAICRQHTSVCLDVMNLALKQSRSSLKLMFDAKNIRKNTVIVPANKTVDLKKFYDAMKQYIKIHSDCLLLSDVEENKPAEAIKNMINDATLKNKKLIYVIKSYRSELAKICFGFENIDMIYVVGTGKTLPRISAETRNKVGLNKYKIRPELILLYKGKNERPKHTKKWLKTLPFHLHHHIRTYQEADWQRLLRFITGKAMTVVLGGGGLRCWAQLGALMALSNAGIPIDAICGVSAGAIVAAHYALNETWKDTGLKLRALSETTRHATSLKNLTWPMVSIFNGKDYTNQLKKVYKNARVENLWLPFFCISTNLATNKSEISRSGSLWKLIRTTTAVPSVFPPVVIKGKLHLDGGLLNNLPVDLMKKMISNQGKVIAVELTHRNEDINEYHFPPILTFWSSFLTRLKIIHREYKFPAFVDTFLKSLLAGSAAKQEENSLLADVLITPDLSKFSLLNISRADENRLIKIGYKATMEKIAKMTGF